jgi:PLP dependent protein
VSKTFPAEAVEPVLAAGQRAFGENYVQEAKAKWTPLRERYPDTELHLIGPLQSNKARDAVRLFDAIHTLDRESLARELAKEIAKAGRAPRLLVQINTGEEAQKGGVVPADADAFIATCRERWGLPVAGLMCIPPVDEPPSPHFALLHKIAERNGLKTLSMGMSADFEAAIQLGATHVRIGSAIFGERAP